MKKPDYSLFDKHGKLKYDVYWKCYDDAVIKLFGSIEEYAKYLNKCDNDLNNIINENKKFL